MKGIDNSIILDSEISQVSSSPVSGLRIKCEISENLVTRSSENFAKEFNCQLCQSGFNDALSLANHKCTMIENVKYDCNECNKSFSSAANLASHKRWHRVTKENSKHPVARKRKSGEANEDKVSCDKRKKSYCKNEVKNHVINMLKSCNPKRTLFQSKQESSDEKTFPCTMCKKKFRKQSFMKRHFDKKHGRVAKTANTSDESLDETKYEFDPKALNEYFDSGLFTLARAAEIHSQRLSGKQEPAVVKSYIKSPSSYILKIDDEKKSVDGQKIKAQNWLPLSPPMSDAMSPLSSIATDSDSNTSSLDNSPSNNSLRSATSTPISEVNTAKEKALSQTFISVPTTLTPYYPYVPNHPQYHPQTTNNKFFPYPNFGPFQGMDPTLLMTQQYISAWRNWTAQAVKSWSARNHLPPIALPRRDREQNL